MSPNGFKLTRSDDGVPIRTDGEIDPLSYADPKDIGGPIGHEPASLQEMRPIFALSDYILVRYNKSRYKYTCPVHEVDHGLYTHGCKPAAFAKNSWGYSGEDGGDYEVLPATEDSVPHTLFKDCPFDRSDPHEHKDFRWQV
jgi:hypothetical protein